MGTLYDEMLQQNERTARPRRLPWILLLAIVAGAAGHMQLAVRLGRARTEAAASLGQVQEDVREMLGNVRKTNADLEGRVATLERENSRLLGRMDELSSSIQTEQYEVAEFKKTAAELEKLRAEVNKAARMKRGKPLLATTRPAPRKAKATSATAQ